jgi:antitoxin component HigA of HigAB toxin-antitoxin module
MAKPFSILRDNLNKHILARIRNNGLINTDHEYAIVLEHIETLWGSEPDTPQGDELEVLFALVEAYEAQGMV